MKITLPQDTYDTLVDRLQANHKAHKGISPFEMIRKMIEKSASHGKDGVDVDLSAVRVAYNAIESNVALAGKRYQRGFDEILLLMLAEVMPSGDSPPESSVAATPKAPAYIEDEDLVLLDLSLLGDD